LIEKNISKIGYGSTFNAIRRNDLESFSIPLPPLNEQNRIVSKLEEVFTKLDEAIQTLKKSKPLLKKYRQSVLKHAFEGDLTAEWRKAHMDEMEPASKLLQRLSNEYGKNTKINSQYATNILSNDSLYKLPEGWTWSRVRSIAESFRNGIYKPENFYTNNGIACLRMYNIENGLVVWKNIRRLALTGQEVSEYKLKPGDIIVNRVNSRELVGKAAVIPPGLETCVYEAMNIRLRVFRKYIESKFVSFWFQLFSRIYFNPIAPQTVGMASINQEQLSSMPIPLAPLLEQRKVIEKIERCFSLANDIERVIDQSLTKAEILVILPFPLLLLYIIILQISFYLSC
jgi:type I restriction enzyme S subunit